MKRILSGVGGIVLALIFVAAGVVCLIMGISRMQKMNAGKYVETKATIVKIETVSVADPDAPGGFRDEHTVTVEYTVDGKKYVSQMSETPDKMYEGMELNVLYNVDDPTEVILPGNTGTYIMIGLGAVGILAGLAVLFKKLRGR